MPTFSEIIFLSLQQIYMTLMAVSIAAVIIIPLAIIVYKKSFFVKGITNIVSLLQSFPALAMFAMLVPLIGIGMSTVIFVLFLYALMPLFLNTIQGFKSIHPEYYQIIKTMNIRPSAIFWKIEFPLILPYIIHGLRLTFIYTLSLATIGTLVGAGGLGDVIYLGLQQVNLAITIAGVVPLIIITIIFNIIFNKLEKVFQPADKKFEDKTWHENK